MRTIGLLLALFGGLSCGGGSGGGTLAPLPPGGQRVLFVGNSLTYVNDLPRTLADLAATVGDTVRVATAAGPDLALVDHVAGASDALPAIRRGARDQRRAGHALRGVRWTSCCVRASTGLRRITTDDSRKLPVATTLRAPVRS